MKYSKHAVACVYHGAEPGCAAALFLLFCREAVASRASLSGAAFRLFSIVRGARDSAHLCVGEPGLMVVRSWYLGDSIRPAVCRDADWVTFVSDGRNWLFLMAMLTFIMLSPEPGASV